MFWNDAVRVGCGVGVAWMLAACAMSDPLQSNLQGCPRGSPGYPQCMSGVAAQSDEARERRRWMARLQREEVEAEARVRRERAVAALSRP